jgi:hypothetical protein
VETNILLGKISRLNLKDVWPLEEKHFTPWLSRNLDQLNDVLGIEMECLHTELQAGEGQRHVDMVVELPNGEVAIIENQYGKADPNHGWRTMHYSLALGAKTAVWIFEDISSDDERLIDFINSHTSGMDIIGVRAEVCKIDNSLPAINFSVIPASQEALKRLKQSRKESKDITTKEIFYGSYFSNLIDETNSLGMRGGHSSRDGHWNYWCTWNSPYGSKNPFEAAFRQKGSEKSYRFQLKLVGEKALDTLELIQEREEELTKNLAFGYKINYDVKESRQAQMIQFYYPRAVDVENINDDEIAELVNWTKEMLAQLYTNIASLKYNKDSNKACLSLV